MEDEELQKQERVKKRRVTKATGGRNTKSYKNKWGENGELQELENEELQDEERMEKRTVTRTRFKNQN